MENLPTDIIEKTLSRLPIESTLQSRRVYKTWRELLGNNKTGLLFTCAYLNNLSMESETQVQLYYGDQYEENLEKSYFMRTLTKLDRVKYSLPVKYLYNHHIVGSCNGLVCLHSNKFDLRICNPVTGESVFLPGLREPENEWSHAAGFGYLPSTNEYKVVRVSKDYSNVEMHRYVEVYTLGSQSGWRRRDEIPYSFSSSGIFANGAIHWKAVLPKRGRGSQKYKIVAYDLADEKVKYVSSPPLHHAKTYDDIRLMLLGRNLCVNHYRGRCYEIIDIWVFKKRIKNTRILRPRVTREEYYDQNWSWSKEFSIVNSEKGMYPMPFAITKSNEVLLLNFNNKLYCFDNNTSTFLTKLWDCNGKGISYLQPIPHMNSLVSIKDLGECFGNNVNSDNDETSGNKISIPLCKRRKY